MLIQRPGHGRYACPVAVKVLSTFGSACKWCCGRADRRLPRPASGPASCANPIHDVCGTVDEHPRDPPGPDRVQILNLGFSPMLFWAPIPTRAQGTERQLYRVTYESMMIRGITKTKNIPFFFFCLRRECMKAEPVRISRKNHRSSLPCGLQGSNIFLLFVCVPRFALSIIRFICILSPQKRKYGVEFYFSSVARRKD